MIVVPFDIEERFKKYNFEYFEGMLPMPSFKIIHSFRYFGMFRCEFLEDYTVINPSIEISDNYDYTDAQLKNILVHEMLHYYLAYTGADVKVTHGDVFNREARRLNKSHRLRITETVNMNEYVRREGTSSIKYFFASIF